MTIKKAQKILSQIGKPLSKSKKRWITDKEFLEAVYAMNGESKFGLRGGEQ